MSRAVSAPSCPESFRGHTQAKLRSAVQRHPRQPCRAEREGSGEKPRLLCRSDRLHRQRRGQGHDLSARRRRSVPSLAGAQARERGAGRARRHALLLRGGFGEGEILFRESGTAGAVGRAAVPGTDAPSQRSARRAARILRHHGEQAAARRFVQASPRRGAAAHRPFSAPGAGRAARTRILHGHGFSPVRIYRGRRQRRAVVRVSAAQGQSARHRVRARRRAAAASRRVQHSGIVSVLLCLRSRRRTWALPRTSNSGPAGTGRVMRCSSICAIPTATASSYSTRIINAWTSRTSRCAGTRPMPASATGSFPHARSGSPKRAALPASSRASRRRRAIR